MDDKARMAVEVSLSASDVGFYWFVQRAGSGKSEWGSGHAMTAEAALKSIADCMAVAWGWAERTAKEQVANAQG